MRVFHGAKDGEYGSVGGVSIWWWLGTFMDCHELEVEKSKDTKGRKNVSVRVHRLCWPETGAYEDQSQLVIDVFRVLTEAYREANRHG